nr:hypothetical protein [Pandoravirus massiliensis]
MWRPSSSLLLFLYLFPGYRIGPFSCVTGARVCLYVCMYVCTRTRPRVSFLLPARIRLCALARSRDDQEKETEEDDCVCVCAVPLTHDVVFVSSMSGKFLSLLFPVAERKKEESESQRACMPLARTRPFFDIFFFEPIEHGRNQEAPKPQTLWHDINF